MDFRSDEEKRMDAMEDRLAVLEEAITLLLGNCPCTVKERMSGHLVDCPVPHVLELLSGGEQ